MDFANRPGDEDRARPSVTLPRATVVGQIGQHTAALWA